MTLFEITCAGFDPDSAVTDYRVLWTLAESERQVLDEIEATGATLRALDHAPGAYSTRDVDFVLPRDSGFLFDRCRYFQRNLPP